MFNKYLKEDYQYTLTEVTFQAVERYEFSEKSRLCAVDNITTAIVGDELNVDFSRQVYFDPEAIFSIKVYNLSAIFGRKYYVILAIPSCVINFLCQVSLLDSSFE